jgi:hypothetical protein
MACIVPKNMPENEHQSTSSTCGFSGVNSGGGALNGSGGCRVRSGGGDLSGNDVCCVTIAPEDVFGGGGAALAVVV